MDWRTPVFDACAGFGDGDRLAWVGKQRGYVRQRTGQMLEHAERVACHDGEHPGARHCARGRPIDRAELITIPLGSWPFRFHVVAQRRAGEGRLRHMSERSERIMLQRASRMSEPSPSEA